MSGQSNTAMILISLNDLAAQGPLKYTRWQQLLIALLKAGIIFPPFSRSLEPVPGYAPDSTEARACSRSLDVCCGGFPMKSM